MSRSKVEGTKIAQAAKDLNVTSVTIRRYIQEFDIETATDENGIKVLPAQALAELQEIRKLKEDGLTNPKVLEHLEEMRTKKSDKAEKPAAKAKATRIAKPAAKGKAKAAVAESDDEDEEEEEEEVRKPAKFKGKGKAAKASAKEVEADTDSDEDEEAEIVADTKSGAKAGRVAARTASADEESSESADGDSDAETSSEGEEGESAPRADGDRPLHALVCQTCSKTFEHANPRLRDCLDCYRAKRKERRRGGDKHKNVIQNPIAQNVVNKAQAAAAPAAQGASAPGGNGAAQGAREARPPREGREQRDFREKESVSNFGVEPRESRDRDMREPRENRDRDFRDREKSAAPARPAAQEQPTAWAQMQKPVRSYRKAIEETRLITGSLKRRLERPDLPEGERRWLEQIYAYQLILHQGWRHLAEYKSGSPSPAKVAHQAQEEA